MKGILMLAMDIGNTHTRLAVFDSSILKEKMVWPTRNLDADALATALHQHEPNGRVWISSVQPAAEQTVVSAAEQGRHTCRIIRSGSDDILPHKLKTPHTTGVDRLLAAMAAGFRHFPGHAGYTVIQCGSAATVDFINADGIFLGGFILPGPSMWLSSLASAAQLPDLSARVPDWENTTPGDSTADAISHGIAAALPQAIAQTALRSGNGTPVVITGGWANAVVPALPGAIHDADLLLHGIRIFAERNGND